MHISQPIVTRRRTSLIPLVDITFILVMFFMLSSTFSKFADLDLAQQSNAAGAAQQASSAEGGEMRGIMINVSANAAVRVNGMAVPMDGLIAALDALHARGARTAIVMPTPEATVQDLVSALERARMSRIGAIAVTR